MSERGLALDMKVSKSFGGKLVLDEVLLQLRAGTVHALVGENGAGKSTLANIAAGLLQPDAGHISRNGVALTAMTVRSARAAGIELVSQHGAFCGALTVAENASLGHEITRHGILDIASRAASLQRCRQVLNLECSINIDVAGLSVGQAQRAEIVTAIDRNASVLLLDEPTAMLAPAEVTDLLRVIRQLAHSGTTVVIVTHRLSEVLACADEVSVLRLGKRVAHFTVSAKDRVDALDSAVTMGARSSLQRDIASAMIGQSSLDQPTFAVPPRSPDVMIQLANISYRPRQTAAQRNDSPLTAIDLRVHAGEIVGIAGISGNGQAHLADAIDGGIDYTGQITMAGSILRTRSVAQRRALGMGRIVEDRHSAGLWMTQSVAANLAIGRPDIEGTWLRQRRQITAFATEQMKAFDIRADSYSTNAADLSGGNQQKMIVARELTRPGLRFLLASQPTRGVDFAASATIHDRIRQAAAAGVAILIISTDLEEILTLCHRVMVLRDGRMSHDIDLASSTTSAARSEIGQLFGEANHGANQRTLGSGANHGANQRTLGSGADHGANQRTLGSEANP
jgi:general nucleoside transport system ATP-binding protein